MATATISTTPTPPPEMVRLRAEMEKRGIAPFRIAKQMKKQQLDKNPYRIYKILDGTRPIPDEFIETVCGLTGIPQHAVLSPEDAEALSQYLRDVAYEEDLQRMGNGY